MFTKISSEIVCGSWEIPCELLEVCAERPGTGIRGLETTAGVGSLVGSVEPVARRVPAEIPLAPPVEGVIILSVSFRFCVVER